MAVADASFKTSIDSMSSGAIADKGLVSVSEERFSSLTAPSCRFETPEFTHGTPSMTYSGCALPALIEFTPRIWTRTPPPGAASPWMTCTPATRPSNPCSRLATAVGRSSAADTDATAPVRSALRWVPYPTTTTSDRVTAIGWIAKFSVAICPAVTATVCSPAAKPMRLARTRCIPSGTAASTKPPSSAMTAARAMPTREFPNLTVLDHPLIRHKLTILRDKHTTTRDFKQLVNEIAMLMAYEVTKDLPLEPVEVETPLEPMQGVRVAGKKLALVPILRAGLGMVEGIAQLIPSARVGHIGIYREHDTLQPVDYYFKIPEG